MVELINQILQTSSPFDIHLIEMKGRKLFTFFVFGDDVALCRYGRRFTN